MMTDDLEEVVKGALFGVATGDALGVPVEFVLRAELTKKPVSEMQGMGTHNQPAGTWSDDSSQTFCLSESLLLGLRSDLFANNLVRWLDEAYWTAHGDVFDVGIGTRTAIQKLASGVGPELSGGEDDFSNGNGSLMRTLPLVFFLRDLKPEERFIWTEKFSAPTHRHVRSIISCFYYLEFARQLLKGKTKQEAYLTLQSGLPAFLLKQNVPEQEIKRLNRLIHGDIYNRNREEIHSSGYVIDTLEASIWCLMRNDNFKDTVLQAVNLGEDSDSTGAVSGGLAGLLYGYRAIPKEWLEALARRADIEVLTEQLIKKLSSH